MMSSTQRDEILKCWKSKTQKLPHEAENWKSVHFFKFLEEITLHKCANMSCRMGLLTMDKKAH